MRTKKCSDCTDPKPITEFYKNRSTKDGYAAYCKVHAVERKKRWEDANPEKRLASRQKWARKYLYGLTPDEYDALVASQGGLCPVCLDPLGERAHVDHDHETGEVRGILHGPCNTMLGHARDNPEVLRRGAEYLDNLKVRG